MDKLNGVQPPMFASVGAANAQKQNESDYTMNSVFTKAAEEKEKVQRDVSLALSPILECGDQIGATLEDTLKKGGPAAGIAYAIADKTNAIMDSYEPKIIALVKEMDALNSTLANDTKLTPEQKKQKFEELQKKLIYLQKEAVTKEQILATLAEKVPMMAAMMQMMESKGLPSNELTEFFLQIVSGINPSASDVTDVGKDENADSQKIMESALGSGATKKLEEKETKLKQKMTELAEKSKQNPNDKEKNDVQMQVLKMELDVLESLKAMFGQNTETQAQ